ncbi:hypothetical protein KC357_g185 [Hortaea werneckii]|nr:hypothetical protein KC357_g185 [Hortaea werneckii]
MSGALSAAPWMSPAPMRPFWYSWLSACWCGLGTEGITLGFPALSGTLVPSTAMSLTSGGSFLLLPPLFASIVKCRKRLLLTWNSMFALSQDRRDSLSTINDIILFSLLYGEVVLQGQSSNWKLKVKAVVGGNPHIHAGRSSGNADTQSSPDIAKLGIAPYYSRRDLDSLRRSTLQTSRANDRNSESQVGTHVCNLNGQQSHVHWLTGLVSSLREPPSRSTQWLPQLIQLIDLYLGILKTAENALWRRPAALYRLSVAGYIQRTIEPEPSNTSKQRKINLRSVYRAFSESSRMPSASSLLRASSSAQVLSDQSKHQAPKEAIVPDVLPALVLWSSCAWSPARRADVLVRVRCCGARAARWGSVVGELVVVREVTWRRERELPILARIQIPDLLTSSQRRPFSPLTVIQPSQRVFHSDADSQVCRMALETSHSAIAVRRCSHDLRIDGRCVLSLSASEWSLGGVGLHPLSFCCANLPYFLNN